MEQAAYHKASPQEALLTAQQNVQRELDAYFDKDKYPVVDLNIPMYAAIVLSILAVLGCIVWFARLRMGRLARNEAKRAYLFVSPWVLGFLALTLGPMLASLFFSFTQYDVLNPAHWIGFKNYSDMFGSDREQIFKALGNAFYLAGLGVPLGLATGLAAGLASGRSRYSGTRSP